MFCEIPEFGRCCFCMPLRRGILTFGYLNIIFSAFMVGVYSWSVHHDFGMTTLFHGIVESMGAELCVAVYCVDIIFTLILLYGAHRQLPNYLKIFYYYTLSTLVAVLLLEIIINVNRHVLSQLELFPLFFAGLCIHIYLIFLVRSLIKKLEMSGHTYENQLQQIVDGQIKIDGNAVYPSTVVPVDTA